MRATISARVRPGRSAPSVTATSRRTASTVFSVASWWESGRHLRGGNQAVVADRCRYTELTVGQDQV